MKIHVHHSSERPATMSLFAETDAEKELVSLMLGPVSGKIDRYFYNGTEEKDLRVVVELTAK